MYQSWDGGERLVAWDTWHPGDLRQYRTIVVLYQYFIASLTIPDFWFEGKTGYSGGRYEFLVIGYRPTDTRRKLLLRESPAL